MCVKRSLATILNSNLNSLVFLVLVFSGRGFSNFVISQGHKSPGQALCCARTGSAPHLLFGAYTHRIKEAGGQAEKESLSCLSLAYLGDKIALLSFCQGNKGLQQRATFKNGVEGWLGVPALRKG